MIMKTFILATFITFFILACASAQDKSDTIKNIEQKIQSINLDTNYQIVTLNNEAFLDSGFIKQQGKGYGQLTGFFKNDTIYKIRELIGITLLHDIATTDYYFRDGNLIFVYEQERYGPDILIDSAGTVDHKKPEPDFEGCYYFVTDKVITKTKGQQKILPNEMFFLSQSKERQLWHSAKKYIDLLINKKKQ